MMFVVDVATLFFGSCVWWMHKNANAAAIQILNKFTIYTWFKFAHGLLVFVLMIGVVVVHFLGGYVKWYGSHCNDKIKPIFWKFKRWHKSLTKWVYWIAKIMIFSG
jgi:hypothetical protein